MTATAKQTAKSGSQQVAIEFYNGTKKMGRGIIARKVAAFIRFVNLRVFYFHCRGSVYLLEQDYCYGECRGENAFCVLKKQKCSDK